jgi:SP family sugar:H+ symporter-like MFS transporter
MVYAYFLIWETKGLTLEQVDRMMEETQSPRHSAAWKPHSTFASEMGMAPEAEDGKALEHHGEKAEAGHVDGATVPRV